MLNLNLWIFMSITSRSHQGLITYESCIQNSAHSIFSSFAFIFFLQRAATPVGARRSSITSDFLAEENRREKELERILDRRIADLKTNTEYILQKYTWQWKASSHQVAVLGFKNEKGKNSWDEFLEMIWASNVLSFAWKGRYTDWMEKKEKISVVWMCFMHRFGDSKTLTFKMKLCANCFVFLFPS